MCTVDCMGQTAGAREPTSTLAATPATVQTVTAGSYAVLST